MFPELRSQQVNLMLATNSIGYLIYFSLFSLPV
jgi:hypothetical protein